MWSNLRSGEKQISRRTVLSALGTAILGASAGCAHPLPPPQGVVTKKGIFGERNNLRIPVLTVGTERMTVNDDALASVLPRSGEPANTVIPPALHDRLEQRYERIYYYVEVKQLSSHGPLIETGDGTRPTVPVLGTKPRYFLDRDAFGQLLVDDRLEYSLSLFDSAKITAITTIIRNGVVRKKFVATDGKEPPYRITVDHGKWKDGARRTRTYYAPRSVYETAQSGTATSFGVIFEERTRPTLHSFSPDPYGNL